MNNTSVCGDCMITPDPDLTEEELVKLGWDLNGEYGEKCPACTAQNVVADGETASHEGDLEEDVAAVLGPMVGIFPEKDEDDKKE